MIHVPVTKQYYNQLSITECSGGPLLILTIWRLDVEMNDWNPAKTSFDIAFLGCIVPSDLIAIFHYR